MSAYQASPSLPTFLSVICFSGLKRCSLQVRPWDIHCPGSLSAFSIRAPETAAALPAARTGGAVPATRIVAANGTRQRKVLRMVHPVRFTARAAILSGPLDRQVHLHIA